MQKLGAGGRAGGRQDGRGRASRLGREGGSHGSRATSGMQGGTTEPLLRFTTLREYLPNSKSVPTQAPVAAPWHLILYMGAL